MAMRSVEFVGKAEGIKLHELSVKSLIEKLSNTLSKLEVEKSSLKDKLLLLYSELAAAKNKTDEDGDPDYSLIALIENQIDQTNEELSDTESNISQTSAELERAEQEYAEIEEEKQQTLFEIQERARITSQDASKANGMFGAWATVGASLNQSFQKNFDALAHAASILDGSVSSVDTQISSSGENGRNRTSDGRGVVSITDATAIAASGMIGSTKPTSASLGSRQISSVRAFGGRLRYAKGGNANHKAPQFDSAQGPVISGCFTIGVNIDGMQKKSSFGTLQSSHNSGISRKSGLKDNSSLIGYSASISGDMKNGVNKKTVSSNVKARQNFHNVSVSTLKTERPMIARRGYNSFTDGLIVQDWELGRYSNYSLSTVRKTAADADYAAYIKNSADYSHISYNHKPIVYIDPATIKEIRGIDDPKFWLYKSTSYSSYIDMARQIPRVYSMVKAGKKLTDLAKREDVIGACVKNYFLAEDITVMRVGNSFILGDEGRHRIMAALIAGVNVPVRITDEFIKKQSQSTVSEKQLEQCSEKASNFRRKFENISSTIPEMISKADKLGLETIVRNEQLAKKVDFGDLDIEVARELVDTIRNAKNKFPFLEFPFIGATQSLNTSLRQNIEASLMRLYIQNNPDPMVSIDDISASVKLQTDAYMAQFAIENDDLAVSINVKKPQRIPKPKPGIETAGYVTEYVGDTYSSRFNGVSINAEIAKDYSLLCKILEKEEKIGASPKGCSSVNYLVNHEIAHQLDDFLNLSSDPDIIRAYKKHAILSEEKQIANVCTYASTNIHEFIAEAWAESQCSSTPRDVAKLIHEKVLLASIAYIKSKKGNDDYVKEREL